jgi:dTDP-4-dehydrorhamnose reductase
VRTSVLNGNSFTGQFSLHERLFHEWATGKVSSLFTDEIRQPVSYSNLADVAVELCERTTLNGVYHWAGLDALSRYSIGQKIAEHFGLNPEKLLKPITRENLTDDPLRPRNLSLLLHPLAGKLRTPAQTFTDQLGELRVPRGCEDWYEKETGRKVVRLLQKSLDY